MEHKREIIRAKNSGFCYGVKRAIDIANEEVEKHDAAGGKRIFSAGPLIHNDIVTDELASKGLAIIKDLSEASSGDTVIIRSHGQTKAFYEEAEKRNISIIDATCPNVTHIHELVRDAEAEGKNVVIVGDRNHAEVIGISGWCTHAIVVGTPEEADLISEDNLYVVAQTTIRKELFDSCVDIFLEKGKKIDVKNTICNATTIRQQSCMETAKKVEMMIVIGGRESSNSRKLYDIANKYCDKAYFIENLKDLPLKEVEKCNKIGVAAGASTPESVIEEVIANMSEIITEMNSMLDFMDDIDKSLRLPRSGEIVNGKVLQATEKEVIVNLGCKKDGIIPKDEVTMEEGQKLTDLFKEGDEIQAKVIRTDDGEIILSKKKLEINEHWDEVAEALENKSTLSVKIVRAVNGGVIAAYKEVSGFIPMSQLSDKYVESADEFIGQTLDVKVNRVDKMKGRAVFSHKVVLAEERAAKIAEIWGKLNVGDIVEGTVMRFTDYGAFVDIGGIDGLLHISEISWGKLKHPQEVLEIGQKINVIILQMNEEKGKISLGYKQNQPEPWTVINEKYEVGQTVEGKVVQIKEYGAFVELEPGLDGLVHISEVAHKRVTNIADEISVGQDVQAQILEIDVDRKRISLSLKACIEAPVAEEAPAAEEVADAE
ncbi:MAG: bifunctional 4-hydroxy-3-methylbut-2-enyl diphosphate reductase/30S ribosomal protein S1 [Firmicutes bacterium]|nr:bifunctional 4-hydroxy-3-methylbut-2-enyl diphosphate reductase/30S ribosomal protein S1 [Bacillota bacterium]